MLSTIRLAVVIALVIIILAIAGFVIIRTGIINNIPFLQDLSPQPRAAVTTSEALLTGIKPLGRLVSMQAQYATAEILVEVRQGVLAACSFGAKFVAEGTVEAGVDLNNLSEDSVSYDPITNSYTILLPPPQLTNCRIDHIARYSASVTACAVNFDEARILAQHTAVNEFRNDAIESDLLGQAQAQADVVLSNFANIITLYDPTQPNIQFAFDSTQVGAIDPSCTPDPPGGWRQTSDSTWER